MNREVLTLCLVHRPPRVLLGMKKRGFGAGRWNGFGGKVMPNEDITSAALRELQEEAGIRARDLEEAGVLEFSFRGHPSVLEVHVFRAGDFEGEPTESDEMLPAWFEESALPFDAMWPDDRHWMPLFLDRRPFHGKFSFDNAENLLHHELRTIDFSL